MPIDSYPFFNSHTRCLDCVAISGPSFLGQCLQGNPLVGDSQSSGRVEHGVGEDQCRVSRNCIANREPTGFESIRVDSIFEKGRWEGGPLYISLLGLQYVIFQENSNTARTDRQDSHGLCAGLASGWLFRRGSQLFSQHNIYPFKSSWVQSYPISSSRGILDQKPSIILESDQY